MANKGKHLIENDYTPVTYDPQYILMVNHLKKYFPIKGGLLSQTVGHVKAVDGVTFNLRRGCTMGLVGESRWGKSTPGRTIRPRNSHRSRPTSHPRHLGIAGGPRSGSAGVYRERPFGIVRHFHVDFAFDVYFALLLFEYDGVDQP